MSRKALQKAILGKKVGMTQIFDEEGNVIPVTMIQAGPCVILDLKTEERDGYQAVKVGFEECREKVLTKPQNGVFKKAGISPRRYVREFRVEGEWKPGDEIKVSVFEEGDVVDVTAVSKGRGFAGGMKRHGFKGFSKSHGTHESFRGVGSTGQRWPQHTRKGTRGPGRYGGTRVTVRNLKVVGVSEEEGILLVKGAVPGPRGGLVEITSRVVKK